MTNYVLQSAPGLAWNKLNDLDQFGSKVLATSGRNSKDRRSESEMWLNLEESVLIFWKILKYYIEKV